MNRLKVQTANIENMVMPPLATSLRDEKPDVVVLQQAACAEARLHLMNPYEVFSFDRGEEARAVKVLVRDAAAVKRVKRLNMRLGWTGPKTGLRHKGRTFMALLLITPFPCWVVNVHFPSGGPSGPNSDAWAESWERVVKFARSRKTVLLVGDFNATVEELRRRAESEGLTLVTVGKVDHALSKGLKPSGVSRNLPGTPEGVHGWGTFTYKQEN